MVSTSGRYAFAGEESAGASFLRQDGSVWTTDKDGLILGLAGRRNHRSDRSRSRANISPRLLEQFGQPYYRRIDQPASPAEKDVLKNCRPIWSRASTLAGDRIVEKLTRAPGNDASLGGLKVVTGRRLVRRSSVGHREYLQDLCREFQGRIASAADH